MTFFSWTGVWRTLDLPLKWVPYPSAFFAEGWGTTNHDRRVEGIDIESGKAPVRAVSDR
jgi:hypothetical protein